MTMRIVTPFGPRLYVRRIEPPRRTKGGIELPDVAQEAPMEGVVLAKGPSVQSPINLGDHILFSRYAGIQVKLSPDDPEGFLILEEADVLGSVLDNPIQTEQKPPSQ